MADGMRPLPQQERSGGDREDLDGRHVVRCIGRKHWGDWAAREGVHGGLA